MLYSKRRKNLGGGRKKRSNRRSFSSKRFRMSGGENDKYHFVVKKIDDFYLNVLADDHFITKLSWYKIGRTIPRAQVLVLIKEVYVNGIHDVHYTNRIGLISTMSMFGNDTIIVSLSLPIKSSTEYESFPIRNSFYTNDEVGTHNTVEFVT